MKRTLFFAPGMPGRFSSNSASIDSYQISITRIIELPLGFEELVDRAFGDAGFGSYFGD